MRLRRRLTASLLPLAGLLWAALLGAGLSLASIGAGHGDLVIVHAMIASRRSKFSLSDARLATVRMAVAKVPPPLR